MDELSQQKVPFFFMVDFLMEKVEVFTENELSASSLLIDFEKFTNSILPHESNKILELHSFPQSKETYKKGFDVVQNDQVVFFYIQQVIFQIFIPDVKIESGETK